MSTESKLQRLFRKRFEPQRKRPVEEVDAPKGGASEPSWPKDAGIGPTGVVVTIVILAILASIGGPALWRLITDAREFSVNTTVQQAAEVVRNRLTLEPDLMNDQSASNTDLVNALLEDYDLNWELEAASDGLGFGFAAETGDETTMKVQFLTKGGVPAGVLSGTVGPTTPWLLSSGRGIRIQAQNSDGAWACALIVMRPDSELGHIVDGNLVGTDIATAGLTADTNGKTKLDVWLAGIWYDSDDEPLGTANWGANACSPVHALTTNTNGFSLPTSGTSWPLANPSQAGTPVPANVWRTMSDAP